MNPGPKKAKKRKESINIHEMKHLKNYPVSASTLRWLFNRKSVGPCWLLNYWDMFILYRTTFYAYLYQGSFDKSIHF